jgi:hypothetical protein
MGSNITWTYGVTALLAALIAAFERYGAVATPVPIPAAQGTTVPAAGARVMTSALAAKHVARKADDRFRPRGRRR